MESEMSSFAEKLAAARAARPTKDVSVCLDAELAQQREELMVAFEAAQAQDESDARLGAPKATDEIVEQLNELAAAAEDALIALRFTRIPGDKWAELTSRHPVRLDVPIDRHYGYNYDAVCNAAASYRDEDGTAYAHRIEGDELVALDADEWAELFDVISGNEAQAIRDAVWSLNEYEPSKRLDALVKGFGAATRSDKK